MNGTPIFAAALRERPRKCSSHVQIPKRGPLATVSFRNFGLAEKWLPKVVKGSQRACMTMVNTPEGGIRHHLDEPRQGDVKPDITMASEDYSVVNAPVTPGYRSSPTNGLDSPGATKPRRERSDVVFELRQSTRIREAVHCLQLYENKCCDVMVVKLVIISSTQKQPVPVLLTFCIWFELAINFTCLPKLK